MRNQINVVVLGKTSQIGQEIQSIVKDNILVTHWTTQFLNRKDINLSKLDSIRKLKEMSFDVLINTAAYTAVDRAEKQQQRCARINALAIEEIASICSRKNALLIHYSTDYVYHNDLTRPLIETDITTPKSTYAITKLLGEKLLRAINRKHFIIRTSWLYSPYKKNFLKTVIEKSRNGDCLQIVDDQHGSPTYASDLAHATLQMINFYFDNVENTDLHGTYNYANSGSTTWYGFAKEIIKQAGIEATIHPISSAEYPGLVKRPSYSILDTTKITENFNLKIPDWKDGLQRCLQNLR